ncbi:MAG: hypothetical protein ABIH23_03625 [bacterium]
MNILVSLLLSAFLVTNAEVLLADTNGSRISQTSVPESPVPQPQDSLPQMLKFSWSAGPAMPQGMQDNHVALIDNWFISVCGFCGGHDGDWKPGVYPRGFLNKVWGLDLAREKKGWVDLPPLPGAPRQAMQGIQFDNTLYLWGGFSYSEPYTYKDGYRLSHENGEWVWNELPSLPSPSAWAGTCALGSKIFCLGGSDYDRERFYTLTDRTRQVDRLGSRLITLDTENLDAGWRELAPCPGTPRCLTAAAELDGKMYFVGGVAVSNSGSYCNVVDSWRYDPASDTWQRLRDLPISGSGTSPGYHLYKNRYILLPCGYQYDTLMKPNGAVVPKYGTPTSIKPTWKKHPQFENTHYFNHCFVYDTQTDLYGTATALPFDDVASITVILGDTVYMFPGETAGFNWNGEYFGHHPEFVLKGEITELNWQ